MMNIILILLKNLNLQNAEGSGVGGCENMLRRVRPDRGAPPETAPASVHSYLLKSYNVFFI